MSNQWRKGKRIAIAGAGPGGVSAALEFLANGFDVRIFEKADEPKPLGGAVLLSSPVLAIMRRHGIDILSLGSKTKTRFANNKGKVRANLRFNPDVEKALGIPGWHYGMLLSPYAAYGMGMAVEDGYFLARAFRDKDLTDRAQIEAGCRVFEGERVAYVNHHVEFARTLGDRFHKAPAPVAWLRDMVFDNTGALQKVIERDYLKDSETMSLHLRELHV